MFAKHWQPGHVKTRLAASISDAAAAEVHKASLATLLRRFAATADCRLLAYAPAEAREAFAELAGAAWRLEPQSEGDLGCRIETHFASAFARGATRAVLIGSDSPTLPQEFVREAFERLESADVVVGPSEDGGYYLIGLRRPIGGLFRDISWSTPRVFPDTVDRLRATGTTYALLKPWYDIDTLADLERLGIELAGDDLEADDLEVFAELRQVVAEKFTKKVARRQCHG